MTAAEKTRTDREFAAIAVAGLLFAILLARAIMAGWTSEYVWAVLEPLSRRPIDALGEPALGGTPVAGLLLDLVLYVFEPVRWPQRAKFVAFLFEPLLATAAFLLVRAAAHDRRRAAIAAIVVLAAPTTLQNGAMIGWCDATWACAALLCVLAVARGRSAAAALAFAFAVVLGGPALALIPFLVVAALRGQFKPGALWLAVPVIAWAIWLGVAAGNEFGRVLVQPVAFLLAPSRGATAAPSIYMFVTAEKASAVVPFGVAAFTLVVAALVVAAGRRRERMPAELLCLTAYVFAAVAAFGLPRATARFDFAADALAIVLATINPAWLPLALLQQLASFLAYMPVAPGIPEAAAFAGAIAILIVPWATARWLALVDPDVIGRRVAVPDSATLARAGIALIAAFLAWTLALRLAGGLGVDAARLWPARRTDFAGLVVFLAVAAALVPAVRRLEDRLRARWRAATAP